MDKFEKLLQMNEVLFDFYGKLITIKRIPLVLKLKKELKHNFDLQAKKNSNKCYIIGLGPSLKNVDLAKLDGDLIVTNRYYKVDGAEKTEPIAYVMCDNDFFNGTNTMDLENAIEFFPNTNFILNGLYANSLKYSYPNKSFYYLLLWDGFVNHSSSLDCSKVLPMSSNVVCTAIYLALFMGYKEIYLVGCDFNSFAHSTAIHAYNDENKSRLWTLSNELFQYSFAADLHIKLNEIATTQKKKIINITDGSLIDAYAFDDQEMQRIKKHV
jgi:hypothetical protein